MSVFQVADSALADEWRRSIIHPKSQTIESLLGVTAPVDKPARFTLRKLLCRPLVKRASPASAWLFRKPTLAVTCWTLSERVAEVVLMLSWFKVFFLSYFQFSGNINLMVILVITGVQKSGLSKVGNWLIFKGGHFVRNWGTAFYTHYYSYFGTRYYDLEYEVAFDGG